VTMNFNEIPLYLHGRLKRPRSVAATATALALPWVVASTALAAEAPTSAAHTACMDKSGGVTSAMLDCIATELQRQDARLNKAYRAAMTPLSASRKKQLLAAQRAWLAFRDANCQFYADPDGGSVVTVVVNDCVLSATASRAFELENLAD
jgi:uncharacterized protein YecT (DUF1311 family)